MGKSPMGLSVVHPVVINLMNDGDIMKPSRRVRFISLAVILLLGACTHPQTEKSFVLENTTNPSSSTPALSAEPTTTPTLGIPLMSPEEMRARVADLLEDNGGCQLPCWWGITPGKTTWEEANDILGGFNPPGKPMDRPDGSWTMYFHTPFTEKGPITHSYSVKDGLVTEIEIYAYDYAPLFQLEDFLETYGQPEEIYIMTFSTDEPGQIFEMDLFYPGMGILMSYSGGDLENAGDKLRNCLQGMDSPFFHLWFPNQRISFKEAEEKFLNNEDLPERLSLEDATGMTVAEFFSILKSKGKVCIETPKSLWP
jgi:hypothetical protein